MRSMLVSTRPLCILTVSIKNSFSSLTENRNRHENTPFILIINKVTYFCIFSLKLRTKLLVLYPSVTHFQIHVDTHYVADVITDDYINFGQQSTVVCNLVLPLWFIYHI